MESSRPERVRFRYVWATRVLMRQLNATEANILAVSPKFATVHDHLSFQWSLKMHGTTCVGEEELEEESAEDRESSDYVAVCLYLNDGPVPTVDLRAAVTIIGDKKDSRDGEMNKVIEEKTMITTQRGKETELHGSNMAHISDYIKANVGGVIRLSVLIEISATVFDVVSYLNSHSPTPVNSFLTANYRARASSKVWKRRSHKSSYCGERNDSRDDDRRPTNERGHSLDEAFNRVMDEARELREQASSQCYVKPKQSCADASSKYEDGEEEHEHLFKKLLVACCETCGQKKTSVSADDSDEAEDDDDDDEYSFECGEQSQERIHDLLANMYFNKVALPNMDYVEDFADFLIDAELNDLPVLKRACERYLCGELNSKKDILTSLLLDMLFLAIVFNLPVMKSMSLSELSNRPEDLAHPEELLKQEEYKSLDRRMRSLSDRNLVELIEEVQRFRQQRLKVHIIRP